MFYSHTFLARKSPLGTVWIAAHLQNRLRKSHVAVTDISSSVNYIMFPEVPIALRLSGHLLLGVVRIYSKKVDYLYHDCNEVATQVRTMFAPVKVNLPEDANCATFQSVTLPDAFELDALELDDPVHSIERPDNHLKTRDEITLPDQIPVEGGEYISIFLSEDSMHSSPQSGRPSLGAGPMEEDILPPFTMDIGLAINSQPTKNTSDGRESFPSNQREEHDEINPQPRENTGSVRELFPSNQMEGLSPSHNENQFAEVSPDFGVMRDAIHNFGPENLSEFGNHANDMIFQKENLDDPMKRKEGLSPIRERLSVSGGDSLSVHLNQNPPSSASTDAPEIPNAGASLGKSFSGLAILPSPAVKEQKAKKSKRKPLFDEAIVLTNADMKKQLEDSSKLVRKRKKLPCLSLDVWKFHWRFHNEQMFEMPSLSGISDKLQETCNKSSLAARIDSTHPHPPEAVNTESPVRQPQLDGCTDEGLAEVVGTMNEQSPIEQPRFDGRTDETFQELFSSPRMEELTPIYSKKIQQMSPIVKTMETDKPWTFNTDVTELAGPLRETPEWNLDVQLDLGTNLTERSILPESPSTDDLNFLEADSTPHSFEKNEVGSMSARTRAVAQYLKQQSPMDQVSKNQMGELSLNRILEGKTRKQCARMLSEALVLKSYDIIDVQQTEPCEVKLTENATQKESRLHESEAELACCHATCARLSQEKELIEKHNEWLNEELTVKVNRLAELRKTHIDFETDMSSKLADVVRKFNKSSISLKRSEERVKEYAMTVSSMEEELISCKNAAATTEEHYAAELSTVQDISTRLTTDPCQTDRVVHLRTAQEFIPWLQ